MHVSLKFELRAPGEAELVKLRHIVGLGLGLDEAARLQGISTATADRHRAHARASLCAEIKRTHAGV